VSEPGARPVPAWAARGGMTLERLSVGMFLLLAIEFVLGVILGLFVTLPSGGGVVAILASAPVLDLHILLALLIVGISLRAVALARRETGRTPLAAATVALLSALVATGAGWAFAFDGQSSAASFVMAIGFLGVLLGAFVLRGRPAHRAGDEPIELRPEPLSR
jgi:hypothetical protein